VLRCPDANAAEPAGAVVRACDFSRDDANLMLAAGLDKHVRIFKVDGERNEKAIGLFAKDMPVSCAAFVGGARGLVCASGRRPFFYTFDVETAAATRVRGPPRASSSSSTGSSHQSLERFAAARDGSDALCAFTAKDGVVALCDVRRGVWATSASGGGLRLNGTARAVAFDAQNATYLYAAGGDAAVCKFDLRALSGGSSSRRGGPCVAKLRDAGASTTSALAASGDLLAVGSESGVVNLYRDDRDLVKAVMSLTTPVDGLTMHRDAGVLVLSSRFKKDSLRVLNLDTLALYANWPTPATPLHYVASTALSARGDFLGIGNDRGRVLLYKLGAPRA